MDLLFQEYKKKQEKLNSFLYEFQKSDKHFFYGWLGTK